MRQPLWAINSSLLFLFLLGQAVFFMIKAPMPRRSSLEPDATKTLEKKSTAVVVDIQTIYGINDLFGTYVQMAPAMAKIVEQPVPEIPDAPGAIPLSIPTEAPKVFIAPLPVVLKGVMYLHDRPAQSIAIIQFQDSKEEINYRVGQLINDAQILKIFTNRIIVVRSNGQQETLYLRENDAGRDLGLETAKALSTMVINQKDGVYQIPVDTFVAQVKTLGQFIDILDLTTVYQKGKSIGCRVGKADKDSLGSKLGFSYDDIIEQVDGLPVTDVTSRVLVFDHILEKKIDDVIKVRVQRGGNPIQLHYGLVKSREGQVSDMAKSSAKTTTKTTAQAAQGQYAEYNFEELQKKMFEQKIKMAPTAHQIEMEERRKMFEARRNTMLSNHHNTSLSGPHKFDVADFNQVGAKK